MAATIGRVSDSSIIDSSDSPISLATGNVDREAGSTIMGCGKARTESFEVAIPKNESNDTDSATAGFKDQDSRRTRRDRDEKDPHSRDTSCPLPFNRTEPSCRIYLWLKVKNCQSLFACGIYTKWISIYYSQLHKKYGDDDGTNCTSRQSMTNN